MKNFPAFIRWFWLLQKRLLRDKSFWLMLVLIPVLVLSMQIIAKEESGIVHITLAMENPSDTLAQKICGDLMNSRGVLRFTEATPEEAEELVKSGGCDATWIFPEDTAEAVRNFAGRKFTNAAVVTVIQREENVITRLAREKLYGALYTHCSYALYDGYLTKEVPEAVNLSDADRKAIYENIFQEEDLFRFVYTDGTAPEEDDSYLLTPIRGFLAVLMAVGALAASMLYSRDRENGAFVWLPSRKQSPYAVLYTGTAVLDIGVLVLFALVLSGMAVSFARECVLMFLYILCCSGFAMFVRLLTGSNVVLGSCIPLFAIIMTVVCPVFFHLQSAGWIGALFPPYAYILSAYNDRYILQMLVYAAVMYGLYFILHRILKRI
ncbi:MAG: ABC transporter permease [Clostridia bacterium]|nr:ABC transporter permease [Clostridia bacterium]